jgi:hypothetical protein
MSRPVKTAAALAVGLVAVLGSAPALADPSPSPTKQEPEAPLVVRVASLLPRAPRPGSAVEITGTVTNTSSTDTVEHVRVVLSRGTVITLRGALHDAEQDGADTDVAIASRQLADKGAHVTTLRPGQHASFDIRTDVGELGLRSSGVYPLRIEARGVIGDNRVQPLGSLPTWLPFFVDLPKQQKVAVVWPLAEPPHQAPDGSFVDDHLATSLSKDGRLNHLLGATRWANQGRPCGDPGAHRNDGRQDPRTTKCEPVPITFAVDPDLAAAVNTMATADHYVYGPGRKRGSGKAAAAEWLDLLKRQVAGTTGSYLGLPYGDPDVAALAGSLAGTDDISQASKLGASVLGGILPGQPVDAVDPPTQGSGTVTTEAIDALLPQTPNRVAVVLDPSAFADLEDLGHSPDAPVTLPPSRTTGTPLHGLVADDTLSTLVLGPTAGQEGSPLAEQRFIAETALLALERPGQSRTFLIAPDRYSDAAPVAAGLALRDLGVLPWLCPVSVEAASQAAEACPDPSSPAETREHDDSDSDPRTSLRRTVDARLPAGYLAAVGSYRTAANQLTTQVVDDTSNQPADVQQRINDLRVRLRKAVARAESAAWRQDPAGQDSALRRLGQAVTAERSGVAVLGGRLLLTSSKGTIQVSVQNSLDLPVRVRLRFTFPGRPPLETGDIAVAAKRSVPAGIKADGLRSGKFPVDVQMLDQAGQPFQRPAQVIVRSTRYGRLALGVTFAAAAVLFIAAGVRIFRRALRKPGDAA